ncbi:hypothetical protein M413DRAFT_208768 [Hebeloma cylindrosporum]|uniref:Homeobox domain-containing protein n=1 Tax=Hebeloma cylindrosporum TaxID=76867 RepID=A0A0C3CV91_HEBCY|nr:hypothetical protein M413DRAFT_208768 [Hebeloma cylindrosporum h7]
MANSTSASADTFIRTNLLSLQSSFFQSLRNGTEVALAAFHEEMTAFNEALTGCAQDLEEETRQMVYSFTQMSDAVIPELIDLDIASEKINQELNEDIDKILNELSLDDTRYLEPETLPPYIQPAYVWLLNHLHNPYPSRQTRTLLSKQTNTPEKDVDLWFTDIRKRIGWNLLRKKHFATRKDMIAAATRFFKPSPMQLDPGTEPETTITFDQEFAAMENTAKHLYSRRFSTSILANRLSAVKEVRPEPDPAGQGTSAREMSSHEVEPIPDSPYASSELVSPSPPTFSSPSSAPSPSQPSSQGRKRRQSNSDFSPSIESRPLKRNRFVLLSILAPLN